MERISLIVLVDGDDIQAGHECLTTCLACQGNSKCPRYNGSATSLPRPSIKNIFISLKTPSATVPGARWLCVGLQCHLITIRRPSVRVRSGTSFLRPPSTSKRTRNNCFWLWDGHGGQRYSVLLLVSVSRSSTSVRRPSSRGDRAFVVNAFRVSANKLRMRPSFVKLSLVSGYIFTHGLLARTSCPISRMTRCAGSVRYAVFLSVMLAYRERP